MRTSSSQFQLLVDYMEKNGDLSRPCDGPHGKLQNMRQWSELAELLNADATGDTKNVEKWRKVWSDFKNNTKKKSARLYRAARGTGGGPACLLKLTDLEQRVLSIIGTRAATGIVEIPEVGLEVAHAEPMETNQPALVETDESPSIFALHEYYQQTCSNPEDWNRPGTSAQPTVLPPREEPVVPVSQDPEDWNRPGTSAQPTVLPPREEPVVPVSRERSGTDLTLCDVSADQVPRTSPGGGVRQHVSQSPTPLPPTPRRRRRRPIVSSPLQRRTRTQTQSDLARQAFVRSDCDWRAFQQEAERERCRLRELEIRNQERWLDLFGQFLILGNRIVDVLEKK